MWEKGFKKKKRGTGEAIAEQLILYMIRFEPKIRNIQSQLREAEEWVSNLANDNLSKQLTERFEQYHCSNHPDFENLLEVDMYKGNLTVTIQSYCCDRFKTYLDFIADNKDPFTANEGFAF